MTTVDSSALARDLHTRTSPIWQVQAEIMKVRTTKLWWLFLIGVVLVTAWALLRNGAVHHYEMYPPLDQYPANERAQAVAQAVQAKTYAGRRGRRRRRTSKQHRAYGVRGCLPCAVGEGRS
ncbi:MAG TPA: hypothetical protein VFC00_00780 [Micromonosporaceae bacterium]|nr:hypothetical protein [Micromonosporaceae bacterium]